MNFIVTDDAAIMISFSVIPSNMVVAVDSFVNAVLQENVKDSLSCPKLG